MAPLPARKATNGTYLLYARVSPKGSTWDAEETSIGVQFDDMRRYVSLRDPYAKFIEVFDEFKSGKNLNRPGVQRILTDLASTSVTWDCLVVWNLDRLSRSIVDAIPIFEKLRDAGCGFISIRQEYLSMTGAMARFNLHQTILIAQLEREMTSERVSAKMHWIAKNGKIPWGNIPMGYRRQAGAKNTLEIDPEPAAVVRELFDAYLNQTESMKDFWLRHRDMLPDRKTIYKILRNPLYVGEFRYDGEIYTAEHPPLIDRKVFDMVQAMLPGGGYRKPHPAAQKYDYLLSGLVRCHCHPDRHMTPYSVKKKDKRYFYYKCTDASCANAINAERLDAAVLERIRDIALAPEFLKSCYEEYEQENNERRKALEPKLAALARLTDEAKKKEANIAGMFTSGIVTRDNMAYWNSELAAARREREEYEKERGALLASLSDVEQQDYFPALLEEIKNWAGLLEQAGDDVALKRNLIMSLILNVECAEKGKFRLNLVMTKCVKWWAVRDSNPRPPGCKPGALAN